MNKLSLGDDPWEIGLLTAPLPRRCVLSSGFTLGQPSAWFALLQGVLHQMQGAAPYSAELDGHITCLRSNTTVVL